MFHHRFPRKHRNYNLRREKADSDYNYKRRETVVGSHVPIIIAVVMCSIEEMNGANDM